ncbi:MAG TPA: hypothetical protein P5084_14640 [Paludibacter sp.]|nr:hypothetical protein [Paludibacter sp.]
MQYNTIRFAACIGVFILIAITISCSTAKQKISFQAGINHGGIVENTDMSLVPGVSTLAEATVDAFTGASQTGFNAGIHINKPIGKNEVETGVDYMFNHHTFNYIDNGNHFIGVRRIALSQIIVPLTYNFFFNRDFDFQLKLGLAVQYNMLNVNDVTVFKLPEYNIHRFSAGPTIGISAFPVKYANGNKLGVYFDMYRGSQIYEDYYNQPGFKMPGSAYLKCGLKYQF